VAIDWSHDFSGSAELRAKPVNYCGEGQWSDPLTLNIAALPGIPGDVTGKDKTCMGTDNTYEIAEVVYANDYEWLLQPGEAGTLSPDGVTCVVTWAADWNGDATLSVRGVNDCGQGDWSPEKMILVQDCTGIDEKEDDEIAVFPNPATGIFTVTLKTNDVVNLEIFNALGKLVYKMQNLQIDGKTNIQVDAAGFSEGLYYLEINGAKTNLIEKIIINK